MSGVTKERWELLKEMHDELLELPAGQRVLHLRKRCNGDETLFREALQLMQIRQFVELEGGLPQVLNENVVEVPSRLGDFELHEEIGRGGMGIVFRARQISLDRVVALKVLPRIGSLTQRRIDRFRRESLAVAKLQHPGIVPVHAIGFDRGFHFFAMDYVDGRSLDRELEFLRGDAVPAGGRPPILPPFEGDNFISRAVRLCAETAEALEYAHRNGIIHRDIKPANILLDPDGRARVVDFGLAKVEHLGSISNTGDLAGTPFYMSPEQALAKKVPVDHRTDVFSLGIVMYELLARGRPFQGDTSNEVLYEITFREPRRLRKRNPRVPPDLETVCRKTLAKRPEERFPTAGELAADLRRFLRHEAVHARRSPFWVRGSGHVARHCNWYVPAALALLLLIVGSFLLTRMAGREKDRQRALQLQPVLEAVDLETWALEELVAPLERARSLREEGLARPLLAGFVQPTIDRIEEVGRERKRDGLGLVQAAVGLGPAGRSTRPPSDRDYFKGVQLLQEAQLLLPDDPELKYWLAPRSAFPRVEFVSDRALEGVEVYRQAIDWYERPMGPPVACGRLPIPGRVPIEPGVYRFTFVRRDAGGVPVTWCELTRVLHHLGKAYRLEPRLLCGPAASAGMFHLSSGSWIDVQPVTNGQYQLFLERSGFVPPPDWPEERDEAWARRPVLGVTHAEAEAYAEWSGKRLPTSAELEELAAVDGLSYPFLSEWTETIPWALVNPDEPYPHYGSRVVCEPALEPGDPPGQRSADRYARSATGFRCARSELGL